MKSARKDFKIAPNTQKNRSQNDLWDVMLGLERVATRPNQAEAQTLADQLNADPWFLNRGQTRFERTGTKLSVERPE
jgi:hypothetical protein